MACFSPLTAWQLDCGQVVFAERGSIRRELTLPCGQCIGCRLERSRQWAVRCVHESQLYDYNSFVTLTYDDSHLPPNSSLVYRDFQLFMKRLRKSTASKVRFYMCGEYGDNLGRPHYHALLFNSFFSDRKFARTLPSGSRLYRSSLLESLWPFGFSSVGDVTFESAAYVARYICKKVTGPAADSHYRRLDPDTGELVRITPEFTRMSLKAPKGAPKGAPGGIGAAWFARYRSDAYAHDGSKDYVVIRGIKMKPPRYYDNLLKQASDFTSDYIEFVRAETARRFAPNNTSERLKVRETVTRARLEFKKRSLL